MHRKLCHLQTIWQHNLRHLSSATKKKLTSGELRQWERLSERVLAAAAKRDKDLSWNYDKTRGGEEKRLRKALGDPAVTKRVPSFEKTNFFAEEGVDSASLNELAEVATSDQSLAPGSFVELRRNEIVTHGVVIGSSTAGALSLTLSLITTGEIWHHRDADIMFSIPGFIDHDLLLRCGKDELAVEQSAIAARLQVLKKTRDFERAVEAASNGVGRQLQDLYHRVKSSHPDHWSRITTKEATRMLDLRPNSPVLILFAVHKHLMRRSKEFVAHPTSFRQTHLFEVRPQSHIDLINKVTRWVRTNDPALSKFAVKAQNLIEISHNLATQYNHERPTKADILIPGFSESNIAIITFLKNSLEATRFIQANPYAAIVPAVIKYVGRHEGEISSADVVRLLADIGVRTPWDDGAAQSEDTQPHGVSPAIADAVGGSLSNEIAVPRLRHQNNSTQEFDYWSDPLKTMRHDFGDMPVYVIDDADAAELDDGISLECIPGEPDAVWVHIHIADPTSILSPDHSFAQEARKRLETHYSVNAISPMLPTKFTNQGLSLGSHTGKPQNVLTFSCKVNPAGEIVDHEVRAAIVRRIHTMLYDDVNVLLGECPPEDTVFYPFSLAAQPVMRDVSHVIPHRDNLVTLRGVSKQLMTHRKKFSMFSFKFPGAEVSVQKSLPTIPKGLPVPVLFRGFPEMNYKVVHYAKADSGSRAMVAEFMKAACRIASRFLLAHGVPALRRKVGMLKCPTDDVLQHLLSMRNEDNDYVSDPLEVLKFGIRAPQAEYTLAPAEHWQMGIQEGEGYVRVTSPLRRYQDMVAHWQIKHALLRQHGVVHTAPPFSESDLIAFASELRVFERTRRKAAMLSQTWWTHLYIDRFMRGLVGDRRTHDPLCVMDAFTVTLSALDMRTRNHLLTVFIPSLGILGRLTVEKEPNWSIGTPLKVKVKEMSMTLTPKLTVELI
ncbi:RNB-domain-containing protein, partial [Rickenella mellea]